MFIRKLPGQKIRNCCIAPLVILGILTIVLVMSGGCTDTYSQGNSGTSSSGSSDCASGYYKSSTSNGHCCRQEFPYYYDGYCQACPEGYAKYNASSGHCCPDGYPVYYNGDCHACPEGYAKYSSSNGHCCPDWYPYYYDGSCSTQPVGSGTTGVGSTGAGSTGGETTGMQIVLGKCPSGTYYYQGACWKQPEGGGTTGGGTTTTTTYYASCSQCQGYYRQYSYRGPSYAVCNNYYQTCLAAGCEKILDNCR